MNTINVPITEVDVWINVFGPAPLNGTTGVFSVGGSGTYCLHTTPPTEDLLGHRFAGSPTTFVLSSGESLWVKSACVNTIIITEDN